MEKLNNIPTKFISEELQKREGIETIEIKPYEDIKITAGEKIFTFTGPAVILVNID